MRRAHKIDQNQADIVSRYRALGAIVDVVSSLPNLGYDLVVQIRQEVFKVEVKDGSKPPSARMLTLSEQNALRLSGKRYRVISSPEEAERHVKNVYAGLEVRET